MSVHLRQIVEHLRRDYFKSIILSDEELKRGEDEITNLKLTRSLVALAICIQDDISISRACEMITDGYHDNGLDGVYYAESSKTLYLIQSKFHKDGNGTIDAGDSHKFIQGVKDLVNARFEKFNSKIQDRKNELEKYLLDTQTKFVLIPIYSGRQNLSMEVAPIYEEYVTEANDLAESFSLYAINLGLIYRFISQGAAGKPIDEDLMLHNWSDVKEPIKSFYGQIAGSDIARFYKTHGRNLFSPNIRVYLGETEVNDGIIDTISESPEYFWYYNNGITALCDEIDKKPIGGNGNSTGIFDCKNLRIVNGAQTVGTLANQADNYSDQLENVKVWIRLIEVSNENTELTKKITRTNNTQNRIDSRDFVSLDLEQKRIYDELLIDNIYYLYKSGEIIAEDQTGFDLNDATVARACFQDDLRHAIQAKREISKLWQDIEKAPYKTLFNNGVRGINLSWEVDILRIVEKLILQKKKTLEKRDQLLIVHGNRFILHMVYQVIKKEKESLYNSKIIESVISPIFEENFELLKQKTDELYPDSVLGSLFKNQSKCTILKDAINATL